MGIRFNSFYSNELHPFVSGMVAVLAESGQRATRPAIADRFLSGRKYKYDQEIAFLRSVAKDLVNQRRENPTDVKDLLNAMIKGKDPRTGQGLTEQSIIGNCTTPLGAQH